MFISVLICTRNRAASLRITLESLLCPSNLQEENWELMIVDNCSTDHTAKICQEFASKFPKHVRLLVEKSVGKSRAMNTAIVAARGDLLALTDDDVLCAPDYIRGIRTTFAGHPTDSAQGRIVLDFEGGRPEWMNDFLDGIMSSRDFGMDVFEWKDNLTTCNMVVRAEVFHKVGGFSPELGPGATGFMDDSEFSMKMRRAGFRSIYAPQIFVNHRFSRERLSKSAVLKSCFRKGRSEAYFVSPPAPMWRFTFYVAKQLAIKQFLALSHRLRGRPAAAMSNRCECRQLVGFFWGHWRLNRGTGRKLSPPDFNGQDTPPSLQQE
jgi:glycosyltransferase involved in cell wall biosynthesis